MGTNKELTFKIKREKISVGNVSHYAMLNKNVGYIRLEDFTPGAAKEIAAILLELKGTRCLFTYTRLAR